MINLVVRLHRLKELICNTILFLHYSLFQKILWKISYNSNGNKFNCKGRLYNCSILISGNDNILEIRESVTLENVSINISGTGNKLIIDRGTRWTEYGRIRIEDEYNTIVIGESCDFRGCFFACGDKNTSIFISRNCLFSANVVIRTTDGHSIINTSGLRINQGRNVKIGEHVWIGNGAVILKGSQIGNDCIIGTQSVVSGKYIPSNCVVIGNPSKIVKENVTWNKKRIF